MIQITYTNGNVQNITPGGSFYSSVVEKKFGTKFKLVQLKKEDYHKHVLDIATDIAVDCSHFSFRGCPVHKVMVHLPSGENQVRILNIISKEEVLTPGPSYKETQKKLRKLHKNDPKPKTFMHFGISS